MDTSRAALLATKLAEDLGLELSISQNELTNATLVGYLSGLRFHVIRDRGLRHLARCVVLQEVQVLVWVELVLFTVDVDPVELQDLLLDVVFVLLEDHVQSVGPVSVVI